MPLVKIIAKTLSHILQVLLYIVAPCVVLARFAQSTLAMASRLTLPPSPSPTESNESDSGFIILVIIAVLLMSALLFGG
jgi:hypothetical protein